MKKYLKWLILVVPTIVFVMLIVNVLRLDVLPTKYVILATIVGIVMLGIIAVLVGVKKRALTIVGGVLAVLYTVAMAVATYFLMATNRVIDDFATTVVEVSEETGDADIATESFILLLNGVDEGAKDNIDSTAANTDVNQMIVVNPVTHKILIVNTPRDYYVYVHGITEMRDKLTHAGYYGAEIPRLTLEDLYDVNIDYYVKVNFETLTNLVDAIGGVDVESDYEFRTSSGTYVNAGWNHMNGKQALAFARERKYFGTGDIQRATDQQIVIKAIFNKIAHSGALLQHFGGIMDSLKDCLRTDVPIDRLKKLVQTQLDEMPEWEIETAAVTGEAIYTTEVYSLDRVNQYYVVVPDEASVAEVRAKMLEVMGE